MDWYLFFFLDMRVVFLRYVGREELLGVKGDDGRRGWWVEKSEMCFEGWIKRIWVWFGRGKGKDGDGGGGDRGGRRGDGWSGERGGWSERWSGEEGGEGDCWIDGVGYG